MGIWTTVRPAIRSVYRTGVYRVIPRARGWIRQLNGDRTTGSGIVITCLAYKRTEYLRRTIHALIRNNPNLLQQSRLIVLVQGNIPDETEDNVQLLNQAAEEFGIDIEVICNGENLGCGLGYSRLAARSLEGTERYMIHLQDDWESRDPIDGYLDEIMNLFNSSPNLGLVRLRSISEPVLDRNLATKQPLNWSARTGNIMTGNGHFTFNPTIIRMEALAGMGEVLYEQDAREKFQKLGYYTGQLDANCFAHIGDERVEDWVR